MDADLQPALDAFMVKAVENFGLDGEITPERAADLLSRDCHLNPDEIRAALEAAFDVKIAKHLDAIPTCPECGQPLTSRPKERRHMEDNHYQECLNGHVWELRSVEGSGD